MWLQQLTSRPMGGRKCQFSSSQNFLRMSCLECTGQQGRDIPIRLVPGKVGWPIYRESYSLATHVPDRELTLKLVISPVNHFIGHIIYIILFQVEENHLPKSHPISPCLHHKWRADPCLPKLQFLPIQDSQSG